MRSFASHAPSDTLLVIKQHPLARGRPQQSPLIEGLAHELGISERVLYIHDPHLPTLLEASLKPSSPKTPKRSRGTSPCHRNNNVALNFPA
jgi:hypothetical protein